MFIESFTKYLLPGAVSVAGETEHLTELRNGILELTLKLDFLTKDKLQPKISLLSPEKEKL